MHYINLIQFCEMTGLTLAEVQHYESKGLVTYTMKGANKFYSLRETYQAKGMLYFMRTHGLSAEQAALRMDEQTRAANQRSHADLPSAAD